MDLQKVRDPTLLVLVRGKRYLCSSSTGVVWIKSGRSVSGVVATSRRDSRDADFFNEKARI